jgi:hypothetical protein
MSGFIPSILAPLDALRSIGAMLGLRPFACVVRKRVWSGERPGVGAKTDTDTLLVNQGADGNLYPVRVKQVTRREIIASGGQLTDRDYRVGQMTPAYAAALGLSSGGIDDTAIDPYPTGQAVELIWLLTTNDGGTHGLPPQGIVCEKLGEEASALHYTVFLRATGRYE